MTTTPRTRNSLILRLRDRDDAQSWEEFVAIYEPVIYRMAIRRGLQHADALELVQRVLIAVARAVDRFQPDRQRARFRTWLYRIAHNEFCTQLAVARRVEGSGDTAVQSLLEQQPSPEEDDFPVEYRRAVFRWAAERVRKNVRPSTWQAFWRTSIEAESIESVAEELGLTVGAVYVARSRVMSQVRTEAADFEEQQS